MPSRSANSDNLYWYKDAIIYELHIKAFADSDQDGTRNQLTLNFNSSSFTQHSQCAG